MRSTKGGFNLNLIQLGHHPTLFSVMTLPANTTSASCKSSFGDSLEHEQARAADWLNPIQAVIKTKILVNRLDISLSISPESRLNDVFGCGLSRGLRGGQNRQMQNEHASLPDFALDTNTTAVRHDDVFDQAQP